MTGTPTESDEAENERHREKARKHKAARDKIMATKTGEKGLLIVNTGTGKGKTSAALGMVFRHIGHGYPVAVVQFTKSPAWDTGEAKVLAKFPELVTLTSWAKASPGKPRIAGVISPLPPRAGTAPRSSSATTAIAWCCWTNSTSCCATITSISTRCLTFLREEKPADKHVVITGRNAKPELIEMADLVTEMTLVKHPFRAGVKGQKGIEF